MSHIIIPPDDFGVVTSVSKFLTKIADWRKKHSIPVQGYHSHAWFRGHSKRTYKLEPGVYRPEFTKQAENIYGADIESKRLNLEREMLMEFRTAGASMINSENVIVVYFLAQHYGMPTRLLDWTTNPLAALFFAVRNEMVFDDGDVLVMQPTKMFSEPPPGSEEPKPYMRTMRHPQIRDSIGMSFWLDPVEKLRCGEPTVKKYPRILAFRPDNSSGRIGQQSSCFTLHTHLATPKNNQTLARLKITGDRKNAIREELRQLNINEFTVYNDLDHLSKELRRSWGL